MPSKKIADIMAQYTAAPKNHMQVLEDNELAIIFEYLTQHNQRKQIDRNQNQRRPILEESSCTT